MAARWVLTPDGLFINDLHEPFARILEHPIQTHPDAQPALRGPDPDAQPALGGSDPDAQPALGGSDPSTSMMVSPTDVIVLALDQTDW